MDTVQDTIVYYSSYYNDNGGGEYGYSQVSHWFLIHGFSFLQFKFLVFFFCPSTHGLLCSKIYSKSEFICIIVVTFSIFD